jgi:hypothetical protein
MTRMLLLLAAVFLAHSLALFLLFPGSFIAARWPWIPRPFGFELYFYGSTIASLGLNTLALRRYWLGTGKVRFALAVCLALAFTFWSTCAGMVAVVNTYGS